MRDAATEALRMTRGRTREELDSDRMFSLAIVRLLEILGEAANRIPRENQAQYPGIPWPQLIGLRNRLIHAYDQIDFDILWQILIQDLPALCSELERILASENT
ncbi:MAG: hypothetical protein ETSY1_41440 [Candidatus Entotheonella factor]|uniref:DUF86 domain-containing protein n=1 Tax=Entotheonella factor TaxID=1429438 RepID=W4L5H9_ENTF1|nr:MAG: hypothetical protein ETSY1_41440 [Candidatus Entotheonella factor]